MSEENRKLEESGGQISRREFLRDAGLVVGGATVGSIALLSACKGTTTTETVTQTATKTVTAAGGGTQTVTVTGSAPAAVTKTVTVTATAPGATVTATVTAAAATTTTLISFTVNKNKISVDVEPNLTLHTLLHDKLGWTGIKEMCNGYGACGSCTTIVNGRPVLACLVLAKECNGAVVETPEGCSKSNPKLFDAMCYQYCAQ
jgi:hypothetical protein